MHRADPKDHYDFDDVAELRKLAARPDPVYPSARVTIAPSGNYMEAVEALLGVERVRCDGDTFLVPEFEKDAIEMLRTRFGGEVELGCGEEWEFSTKAGLEGVSDRFIRLGTAVQTITGQTADEMLDAVILQPDATWIAWRSLYESRMFPQ